MIEVRIEKLVYKGLGFGHLDTGQGIFVPQGLPGDILSVEISKRRRKYLEGRIVDVLTPSPFRRASQCVHFPDCGGCQLIHVDYAGQLELKNMILQDSIEREFPSILPLLLPIISSPRSQYYRNKMEFSFGLSGEQLILGLKKRGTYDAVVSTPECQLMSELAMKICEFSASYFSELGFSSWDYEAHVGDLRYLVIRRSHTHDGYMVILVAGHDHAEAFSRFAEALSVAFSQVRSIYWALQDSPSDTAHSSSHTLLFGDDTITEKLMDFEFLISPSSFFQTNSLGAEVLYETIRTLSKVSSEDTVLDLYCGTGTIGLFLAPHARHVIGIEENQAAVLNARENAAMNDVQNIEFACGRVKNVLKFHEFDVDLVVVDPPRSGMVPKALRRMCDLGAARIVYVSCNPMTFLRDLKEIVAAGYRVESLRPVDMFPNTYHLETVCVLSQTHLS